MRRNTLQVKAIDRFTGSQRGLYRKVSNGTIGVDAIIAWEYLKNPDEQDLNKQVWEEAKDEQEASVLATKERTMTYKQIQQEKSPIKRKALTEQAYLTYFNDFLSVACFAEWLTCTEEEALAIIAEGKHWNNLPKIVAVEA